MIFCWIGLRATLLKVGPTLIYGSATFPEWWTYGTTVQLFIGVTVAQECPSRLELLWSSLIGLFSLDKLLYCRRVTSCVSNAVVSMYLDNNIMILTVRSSAISVSVITKNSKRKEIQLHQLFCSSVNRYCSLLSRVEQPGRTKFVKVI
jgi:hypothetical protein